MHKLTELRETLVKELEEYANSEQLDVSALDIIDKLAHAVKNIDKVIDADCCDDYDSRSGYDYYDRGVYSKRGRMSGSHRRFTMDNRDDMQNRTESNRISQRYE